MIDGIKTVTQSTIGGHFIMMRSLYAGVSGLKTHQTKMDIIGNNIANVNTVAYKASAITFSEMMYQTTQSASGANAETGRGGINARQIGLGVQTGAITTNIAKPGGAQSTGNPLDMMISGDAFFVVSDGVSNYFTRDGSFNTDGAGNLVMRSTGFPVMGWGVDPETNEISQDSVTAIQINSANNLTYPAEATSKGYVAGIIDKNDPSVDSEGGKKINMKIYDNLGYQYTARFSIHSANEEGEFYIELDDILDSDGKSVKDTYNVADLSEIVSFGKETAMTKTELKQLAKGVEYNSADDTYSKEMSNSNFFSDYDKAITGLVYENSGTAGTAIEKDDLIAMTGTGTMDKEYILAKGKKFGVMFQEGSPEIVADNTVDPPIVGSPEVLAGYVMRDGDTGKTKPIASKADWAEVLGLNQDEITNTDFPVNADGGIEFNVAQTFKANYDGSFKDTKTFESALEREEAYGLDTSNPDVKYEFVTAPDGQAVITSTEYFFGNLVKYDTENGEFISVGDPAGDDVVLDFKDSVVDLDGESVGLGHFSDIEIDFSKSTNVNKGGKSTVSASNGDVDNISLGTGRKVGKMIGFSTAPDGKIYASYDNAQRKLLGQIAVATFTNAAGLEKAGDNLYMATMNSGDFDGTGVDITAGGDGKIVSSFLEMSNVDLSQEFTDMITTQRGFQANSRIITTSDSMLEELVNLKR